MSKAVAVDGDTQFATSTVNHPADTNNSGEWEPVGKPVVTRGQRISVNGKKVELGAVMTWTYVRGTAGTNPVVAVGPFPDTATLTAGPTKLTDTNQHVLVVGDEATGTVDAGNKIIVKKSQDILTTA